MLCLPIATFFSTVSSLILVPDSRPLNSRECLVSSLLPLWEKEGAGDRIIIHYAYMESSVGPHVGLTSFLTGEHLHMVQPHRTPPNTLGLNCVCFYVHLYPL